MRIFVVFCLYWGLGAAVGPLLSDGWTPVTSSKVVQLPYDYLERQKPVKIDNNNAQDRIDEIEPLLQTLEEEVEEEAKVELELEQQEQQLRRQQQLESLKQQRQKEEEEKKPLIVYPQGTYEQETEISREEQPRPRPQQPPPRRWPRPPQSGGRYSPPPIPRRRLPPPGLSRQAPPLPQQRPLRPRPRPDRPPPPPRRGPAAKPQSGIISSIKNIGSSIKCAAEDVAADVRLKDKSYMQKQIKCVLNEGPCDNIGSTIKRMAPDIMRGMCPSPCNHCKKKQIQKIMATLAKDYPFEWTQMIKAFG